MLAEQREALRVDPKRLEVAFVDVDDRRFEKSLQFHQSGGVVNVIELLDLIDLRQRVARLVRPEGIMKCQNDQHHPENRQGGTANHASREIKPSRRRAKRRSSVKNLAQCMVVARRKGQPPRGTKGGDQGQMVGLAWHRSVAFERVQRLGEFVVALAAGPHQVVAKSLALLNQARSIIHDGSTYCVMPDSIPFGVEQVQGWPYTVA